MRIRCFLVLFLLLCGAPNVFSQQARSFEQLQMLVELDDTVTVRDTAGTVTQGRILMLTDSVLQLRSAGSTRSLSEKDVQWVRQRRSDSLANGAIWGASIGGGLGVLGAIYNSIETDCNFGCVTAIVAVNAVFGAGAGVGIDALIRSEKTIFSPADSLSGTFRFRPIMTGGSKGLAVSWSF